VPLQVFSGETTSILAQDLRPSLRHYWTGCVRKAIIDF